MFEKEVLEIAKDVYLHHFDDDVKYPDVLNAIIIGAQRGAEFGYNKVLEAQGDKIESAYREGVAFGRGEWHYVKDGDLPKDEKEVLVYMWGSFYIGYYSEKYDENNRWQFADFSEESEQVTAWKEIVPPKESE